jgi:tetratricopeptide (TPR) repeat protein
MQRKLEEMRDTLSGFVDQRDNLLLVVSGTDAEVPYTLKTLEGLDDVAPSDLFLLFAEPFTGAPRYASQVVQSLHTQMKLAEVDLAKRQQEPWPPLPSLCDDDDAPPHDRIRAAIDHIASLLPAEEDHRLVVGLLPFHIADQEGYARLVGELIPWDGPMLWMKGLRIVARDDSASPFLIPILRKKKAPGVLLYEPDLRPEALNDALVKGAADPSLPVVERMQILAQLAGLDYAHQRYAGAIEKYKILYNYYAESESPAMQAVTLQGVGDVLRRIGKLEEAKEKYQQGLALALEAEALPVLLNLTFAAGDVSLELNEHEQAEGFFGLSQALAGKLLNPFAKADALEQQGIARDRARDGAGAIVVWSDASTLCETFSYHERRRSVLERLIAAYRDAGMSSERHACEEGLRATLHAMKEGKQ